MTSITHLVRLSRVRDGGVEADAYLRTSNPAVYAAGDVAFPEKYTHAAMATARLCVANAMDGAGRPARDLVIPHCTYTDPEVATVGLTPVRAAEEGGERQKVGGRAIRGSLERWLKQSPSNA